MGLLALKCQKRKMYSPIQYKPSYMAQTDNSESNVALYLDIEINSTWFTSLLYMFENMKVFELTGGRLLLFKLYFSSRTLRRRQHFLI